MKTWLFFDLWHMDRVDNVVLRQGRATWDSTFLYEDPVYPSVGYPTVYWDDAHREYRLIYMATGFPMRVMIAHSADGDRFVPLDVSAETSETDQVAPHHTFTVGDATGSQVFVDPVSRDARFRMFVTQKGGGEDLPPDEQGNPDLLVPRPFDAERESRRDIGHKPYVAHDLVASSPDGVRWTLDTDHEWGRPFWHPEAPIDCFRNTATGEYTMVTRTGWGDRRLAVQYTTDFRQWRGPHFLMQPDPLDPPLTQFYAMPVIPYETYYIGLLWTGHFANARPLERYNQIEGTVDCQLTYSFDGLTFQRGMREPLVPLNEPGQPGSGVVYPTSIVEDGADLLVYSASRPHLHGPWPEEGAPPKGALIRHRLRRDGFTYLESGGTWASFTSKPFLVRDPAFTVNIAAPYGQARVRITDVEARPVAGFDYADCRALDGADDTAAALEWSGDRESLRGRCVRLEMEFRHARIYAIRGDFHFVDANDRWLAADGQSIDTALFDF